MFKREFRKTLANSIFDFLIDKKKKKGKHKSVGAGTTYNAPPYFHSLTLSLAHCK